MLTSPEGIGRTSDRRDSRLPASDIVVLIVNTVSPRLCLRPLVQITMICQSLELNAQRLTLSDPRSYLQFMLSMCFHRISSATSRRKVIKILSFFGKLVEINFPMEPY